MLAPLPMGLTMNGQRDTATAQAVRVRLTLPTDATRIRVSLAPGYQDAEELVLPTTDVALTGAVLGRAGSSGVITEILHEWGPQDLSSGSWLSEWADLPLTAGDPLTLSFGYTNPQGLGLANGTAGAWKSATAADYSRVGGSAWTRDHMVRGPMSPAVVYDTPRDLPLVVVVGDSNAAGRGTALPYHECFAHVAGRTSGMPVVSAGYTGETLSDFLVAGSPKWTRTLSLAGGTTADAVVVQAGFNDINIGRTSTRVLGDLASVVTRARQVAPVVYVCTIPPGSLSGAPETVRQEVNAAIRSGAYGGGVIDLDEALRSASVPSEIATQYAGSDAVHYGAAGHVAAAQRLQPLIVSLMPAQPAGTVAYGDLPAGAVILRDPTGGRRVALREVATGRYLGQASPVARLFAPEDPAWQWAELPDDTGAVMATYPYPIAPTSGAPMLISEGPVVTGNASGLGPAGSAYTWQVERLGTQPAILTGPLMRARTTGSGTPLRVTLTITPPTGPATTLEQQVTCLSMDTTRGRHVADIGGRARTIDARFTAPVAGTYRVLWEQLDEHAQLLPRASRLTAVTLTAGQQHTPALVVTPPSVTARRTYAWRAIIEDPTGGVSVSRTVYDTVHPAAVADPVGDDRLPVPAGPLAQPVTGFPLHATGEDPHNAALTQAQAVSAFTSQINAGGMVLNCTDFGIAHGIADLSNPESMVPIDGQHKLASDYGWPLSTWGQLVAPRVVPEGITQATGSDGTLGLYDPATHAYSETWKTTLDERGRLRATQGGHENLLTSDGRWTRPGAGVSAAGFMQGPHVLSLHAVQACIARTIAGQGFDDLITHALLVALPQVRGTVAGQKVWTHPATRTDGTGAQTTPLMGARFRLAPIIDMNTWSPLARVIGRWLQVMGCVIADTTGGGAAIICRAYPERMMGGAPNPWSVVFPEGRGWSSALPEIGRTVAWQALRLGHQGTLPSGPIMPPPTGLTGDTETVVVDGAHVTITDLL